MLRKVIRFTDYDGNEREETFHFNLSRAEIIEMEHGVAGGLVRKLQRLQETRDPQEIVAVFREIILKAYGEKSPDGRRFIKSAALAEAFSQTEAYSELIIELLTNETANVAFVKGILPSLSPEQYADIDAKLK